MNDACRVSLSTTRAVMAALGGTRAVAQLTNRKYSAAANWLLSIDGKEPAFPSNTYVVMNEALAAKGKTASVSLWGMVSAPSDQADELAVDQSHEGGAA